MWRAISFTSLSFLHNAGLFLSVQEEDDLYSGYEAEGPLAVEKRLRSLKVQAGYVSDVRVTCAGWSHYCKFWTSQLCTRQVWAQSHLLLFVQHHKQYRFTLQVPRCFVAHLQMCLRSQAPELAQH